MLISLLNSPGICERECDRTPSLNATGFLSSNWSLSIICLIISKSSSCWLAPEGVSDVPGKCGFNAALFSLLNLVWKMRGREGLRESGPTIALLSCGSEMVGSTSNLEGKGRRKGEEEGGGGRGYRVRNAVSSVTQSSYNSLQC